MFLYLLSINKYFNTRSLNLSCANNLYFYFRFVM